MKERIFITGPTAVGKTGLSIVLAERFGAEIVSVDAVQLYRGLDIGSAKPSAEERRRVPHHLLDLLDPRERADAAWFVRRAEEAAAEIESRGRRVFFVGGSAFYLRALRFGLCEAPPVDPALRKSLLEEAARLGRGAMHERLRRIDPKRAVEIHPNDTYRVVRALEIHASSGRLPSELYARHRAAPLPPGSRLVIALHRERGELYERIDRRVEGMIAQGLVAEVEALLAAGVPPDAPGLRSLGYRQVVAVLQGKHTLAEGVALIGRDTRRFAKRQLTWFRKDPEIVWSAADDAGGIGERIARFLEGAAKREVSQKG